LIGRRLAAGEVPGTAEEVVSGGWEHEHCELCWATISPHDGHQPTGYTDGKEWLCISCFGKYIAPRL